LLLVFPVSPAGALDGPTPVKLVYLQVAGGSVTDVLAAASLHHCIASPTRKCETGAMSHGFVEVFAYQETLLIMAVFGTAILAMLWVGFQRWLRVQEKIGGEIADQSAERSAQIETRLQAIEQIVTDRVQTPAQSKASRDQA
jgi:hypothetical protein